MPCHAAIADKALTIKVDSTIEAALKAMKKAKVEYAPVTDEDGAIVGLLSYHILMKNLLPVSVTMNDGMQMDVNIPAAPGIAKRLRNVLLLTVDTVMERKNFPVVYAATPTWEGVSMMVQTGLPLTVIDPETQKYIGFITQTSLLDELQRLHEKDK
ncbi:MAG: CBS domain-containing protein [Alphaproteobacteria bacterium]|nr:CBS domain-containing protein [Alphaproteobacteria bacterium]